MAFCENNIIERIIDVTNYKEKKINLIVIKCFSLLIPNIKNQKISYYLFSKNYMNRIICNISYNNTDDDIDYLSFYINFLKTLANKIDLDSFHLFFNRNYHRFPLLDEIIVFLTYDKDIMIKNTSRNIFLTLLKLNYKPFIEYICDLPSITLFLLFSDNLKNQFIYFCKIKENMKNNSTIIMSNNNKEDIKNNNLFNELEEQKEVLEDDISFIQDILSINIPKINYLLTNVIFYIFLKYLFNNILLRQNAEISFYVITLFLNIIKSQAIKNIIIFILYYSKIQINIIEIVANEEILDVYRLLALNKCVFKSDFKDKLIFDDYIILNYSSRFLNSLKHIKETDNIYPELIDISRKLNNINDIENETENEIKTAIKLLNKNIKRINCVLKQIEEYHNFVSKATGINIGVSINSASHSFLQIIYNNFSENLCMQENIFKNECIYYLNNFHLSQYLCTVNEIFLLSLIIKDNDISRCLKFNINLMNEISFAKDDDVIISNIDNIHINQNFDTPPPASFKFNSINNYSKIYENKNKIYKNLFGIETNDKNNDIYLTSFLSLPNIINNRTDISSYDDSINLIVNNKIISYKEMDLNNRFFDEILSDNKSSNELSIMDKLINLLIDEKKTLNKIIYKLCIDIIYDLLKNGNNICQINEDKKTKIDERYKQILQIINDLLEKSTLEEQIENDKYFYEFFQDCFILNAMEISFIKKNYLNTMVYIINEENLKEYNDNIGLDLMRIPNEKYQMLKCLFQKFISLYDLKIKLEYKENQNFALKYQKFPLNFFDISEYNNEFDENSRNKLNTESYKLKYKTEKDLSFKNGLLLFYKNVLLIFTNKNDNENNIININDTYVIDQVIPLRKIKSEEKEFDKSKYLILNIMNNLNMIKIILSLENNTDLNKINNIILNETKKSIDMEYSSLKSYFKKILEDENLSIEDNK